MLKSDLRWETVNDGIWSEHSADHGFPRVIDWFKNFEIIRDTIGFSKSVTDLPAIKKSALIVDKSMASTKYFEQLPEIANYKGTIISCDRALNTIIPYRIPEYVCNLDSSPLCLSFFDRPDVKKVMDNITAIFAVTTNPLTVRLWHGKRAFFTPSLCSAGLTKCLMESSATPFMETGGQVASFALVLAYNLGANPIGVFGVTHGYDKPEESEYPFERLRRIKGRYGDVWQDATYRFYNDKFLKFIVQIAKEGIITVNTMKGGLLYSKHVKDMPLKEFVQTYV